MSDYKFKDYYPVIALVLIIFFAEINTSAYARSLQEIRKSNEIRLCAAGSSSSLYSRMGTVFAESLGIKAKIIKLDSWDQQFHNKDGVTIKQESYTPFLMEKGDCDCYPNDLVMHEWRMKKLDFVVLFKTRMTVVTHRDKKGEFTTENDLKGKTAAVMKGTTYHTWLEEKNKTDFADNPVLIKFMSTDDSMKAVDSKSVDFTVIGADGALNWTRNKIKNSETAFFVGPVTQVGWAFKKSDKDLQKAAQECFRSLQKAGSAFDTIWKEEVGIPLSDYILFITNLTGK